MKTLEEKKQRFAELAEGRELIKCDNQVIYEMIKRGNVKEIAENFYHIYEGYNIKGSHSGKLIVNDIANALLEMIAINSNDFTKDIASRSLENEYELSGKQAWCCAYQIKNNQEVYLMQVLNEWDQTTKMAEPDDLMNESDIELNRLGYEIFAETL
ncbi:MAG: hypothetical protein ACFFD1_00785 [Candidatus Thorarchaeota archaeon]